MRNMFFSIVNGAGIDVSHAIKDNGILEFTVPGDFERKEISDYLSNLTPEECNEIISIQKKKKEKFRRKINKMIGEYQQEFGLQFSINLRLQSKPKSLINSQFDIYGIMPEGLITMADVLQFYPDDIVKMIVRFAVSAIAVKCENRFRKITAMETTSISGPDRLTEKTVSHITESEKYHLPFSKDMMKGIEDDCIEAIKKVCEDMKENPILSAFMD